MRYIDLGNLPLNSPEQKRKRKKKIFFLSAGLILVTVVAVFGYAFYWPLSALIGEILKNPGIVLSFFKEPAAEFLSTDGKTNVLLLGIDKRSNVPYTYIGPSGKQERNGFLSDTIIVASFDHESKKVSLISIPRDTWVSIPGWEKFPDTQGKINAAHSLGDSFDYPDGGLQLIKKVISQHLGIPIHYGARIDFEGFIKMIDILGGIEVVVERTFDDYRYPVAGKENAICAGGGDYCRYEHVHFDKGSTQMDGETALRFVRSRTGTNGEGNDFARGRRQQKIIKASLKKALALENILNPLTLNSLFKEFGESLETDFNFTALPQAIKLVQEVDVGSFKTFVLDPSSGLMVRPASNLYGGAYVIIPKNGDWGPVKLKIRQFLSPPENVPEKEKE